MDLNGNYPPDGGQPLDTVHPSFAFQPNIASIETNFLSYPPIYGDNQVTAHFNYSNYHSYQDTPHIASTPYCTFMGSNPPVICHNCNTNNDHNATGAADQIGNSQVSVTQAALTQNQTHNSPPEMTFTVDRERLFSCNASEITASPPDNRIRLDADSVHSCFQPIHSTLAQNLPSPTSSFRTVSSVPLRPTSDAPSTQTSGKRTSRKKYLARVLRKQRNYLKCVEKTINIISSDSETENESSAGKVDTINQQDDNGSSTTGTQNLQRSTDSGSRSSLSVSGTEPAAYDEPIFGIYSPLEKYYFKGRLCSLNLPLILRERFTVRDHKNVQCKKCREIINVQAYKSAYEPLFSHPCYAVIQQLRSWRELELFNGNSTKLKSIFKTSGLSKYFVYDGSVKDQVKARCIECGSHQPIFKSTQSIGHFNALIDHVRLHGIKTVFGVRAPGKNKLFARKSSPAFTTKSLKTKLPIVDFDCFKLVGPRLVQCHQLVFSGTNNAMMICGVFIDIGGKTIYALKHHICRDKILLFDGDDDNSHSTENTTGGGYSTATTVPDNCLELKSFSELSPEVKKFAIENITQTGMSQFEQSFFQPNTDTSFLSTGSSHNNQSLNISNSREEGLTGDQQFGLIASNPFVFIKLITNRQFYDETIREYEAIKAKIKEYVVRKIKETPVADGRAQRNKFAENCVSYVIGADGLFSRPSLTAGHLFIYTGHTIEPVSRLNNHKWCISKAIGGSNDTKVTPVHAMIANAWTMEKTSVSMIVVDDENVSRLEAQFTEHSIIQFKRGSRLFQNVRHGEMSSIRETLNAIDIKVTNSDFIRFGAALTIATHQRLLDGHIFKRDQLHIDGSNCWALIGNWCSIRLSEIMRIFDNIASLKNMAIGSEADGDDYSNSQRQFASLDVFKPTIGYDLGKVGDDCIEALTRYANDLFQGLFTTPFVWALFYANNINGHELLIKNTSVERAVAIFDSIRMVYYSRPKELNDCFAWASSLFNRLFNSNIQYRIKRTRCNAKKPVLTPLTFNVKNPQHLKFFTVSAYLHAQNYSIDTGDFLDALNKWLHTHPTCHEVKPLPNASFVTATHGRPYTALERIMQVTFWKNEKLPSQEDIKKLELEPMNYNDGDRWLTYWHNLFVNLRYSCINPGVDRQYCVKKTHRFYQDAILYCHYIHHLA